MYTILFKSSSIGTDSSVFIPAEIKMDNSIHVLLLKLLIKIIFHYEKKLH